MRCNALIQVKTLKNGKTKITKIISAFQHRVLGMKPEPGVKFQKCSGRIIVRIPYSSASIFYDDSCENDGPSPEAEYKCSKCGCVSFPHLPSDIDDVAKMLTKSIAEMGRNKETKLFILTKDRVIFNSNFLRALHRINQTANHKRKSQ